ncbi:carboxypeptidase M32 [Flavisolibacter nicotianae]|uniref:carboxypeptidase M32 n=1 Tax=Flavisolibacter nicotianae TaxID=2364882 RepID=UPI000EB25A6F|nr:carboxypeptidase M32 [Flavisolibacter nicotianae]
MPTSEQRYSAYREKMQRIADVRYASAVLQWDQETYLPPKSARFRGQQISTLAELSHQLFSEDSLGDLLRELSQDSELSPVQKRNVALTLEDYTKNKKYTPALVRALSDAVNKAFHSWIEARKQNSFAIYQDDLEALVKLKKEEAGVLGYLQHPYDALLNEYEKGTTVALLDKTFGGLLPQLKDLYEKILHRPQVDDSFLRQHFPASQQWDWGMELLKALHFNFETGRQDKSEHPFTTSFSAEDVRITTRIDENDFGNMTWSCIHELGHALYEQGLPAGEYGLPLGEACSFSIHESQSRLWENNVGRSKGFWQHWYPVVQRHFPQQFKDVSLDRFYKGINKVQPSLIRTEADEISYHFHVSIRYELEKRLLEGSLHTADIPHYWNEQYKQLLDVDVPDDKQGALQDVHWSHGSFGYFPTYSLGSLYAAQLFAHVRKSIKGLDEQISTGQTQELLAWLREKIHSKGRLFISEDLCKEVTGEPLNPDYFLAYATEKYMSIYS